MSGDHLGVLNAGSSANRRSVSTIGIGTRTQASRIVMYGLILIAGDGRSIVNPLPGLRLIWIANVRVAITCTSRHVLKQVSGIHPTVPPYHVVRDLSSFQQ